MAGITFYRVYRILLKEYCELENISYEKDSSVEDLENKIIKFAKKPNSTRAIFDAGVILERCRNQVFCAEEWDDLLEWSGVARFRQLFL